MSSMMKAAESRLKTPGQHCCVFQEPSLPPAASKYRSMKELSILFSAPTYAALWEEINAPDSWGFSPWIWVIEFKKLPCF